MHAAFKFCCYCVNFYWAVTVLQFRTYSTQNSNPHHHFKARIVRVTDWGVWKALIDNIPLDRVHSAYRLQDFQRSVYPRRAVDNRFIDSSGLARLMIFDSTCDHFAVFGLESESPNQVRCVRTPKEIQHEGLIRFTTERVKLRADMKAPGVWPNTISPVAPATRGYY